jgi:tetrahydromethanopterin S-methyltransferase subunit C
MFAISRLSRRPTHRSYPAALSKACVLVAAMLALPATAAQGEMGTGVPHFGSYSAATGVETQIWGLADATRPFPAGCTSLVLNPTTMGMDAYKIAVATLLVARTTNRAVRFYAHAQHGGGCGVDYVQLN